MERVIILFLFALATTSAVPTIDTIVKAQQYLLQYNYLAESDMQKDVKDVKYLVKLALLNFQSFSNVPMTGNLDDATMAMMNTPRCGMADMKMINGDEARRKRYSAGGGWRNTDLTFRIDGVTPDIPDRNTVEEILTRALDYWSQVTPLTFTRVYGQYTNADIIINFREFSHSDNNPFDGPGGTLAHAFFPGSGIGGDAHFDESENFDVAGNGINLFQVAVHEFGHSLGLGHSSVNQAVMAPFYQGYRPNYQLHPDDIAGIQYIYGENSGNNPDVTMPTIGRTMPPTSPCTGRFDAITSTQDGSVYMFQGKFAFKLFSSGIEDGWPRPISSTFQGLEDDIDAALFWEDTGKTFFFKGNQYWAFTNTIMDAGFPQPISQWNGLPEDIDAAFVWSGNGRSYFIKGDQYYRYNSFSQQIDPGYPRSLRIWRGIPSGVRAAFQYSNDRTYFFHDGDYYRFNDNTFNVDTGYPRPTPRWWLGCAAQNVAVAENEVTTPTSASEASALPSLVVMLITSFLGYNIQL